MKSARGTVLVLFKNNTYTPNEKRRFDKARRDWKCSMYYKAHCKARVVTTIRGTKEFIKQTFFDHTHEPMLPYSY